jgi:hypothetical protein
MTPGQKNRLTLAAIVGIFVIFAIAGRMINVSHLPKSNKGHLIVPHVPIEQLQLTREGKPFGNQDVAHWTLMYIAGENCQAICKDALFYQMKRTRMSLGKDSSRVQLAVVETQHNPALSDFLKQKVPDAILLKGQAPWVEAALKTAMAGALPFGHVYIVSPDGLIFMWYDSHPDKDGTILESRHIYDDMMRTLRGSLTG